MEYVFRFGYETVAQACANELHGWDDESSQLVVIVAPDADSAFAWGQEIAERFVLQLCGVSWKSGDFAHWIVSLSSCPEAVGYPMVEVGQYPEFSDWG
jgi:hypothetical protein